MCSINTDVLFIPELETKKICHMIFPIADYIVM